MGVELREYHNFKLPNQVRRLVAVDTEGNEVAVPYSEWKSCNAVHFLLKVLDRKGNEINQHHIEIGPKGGIYVNQKWFLKHPTVQEKFEVMTEEPTDV